MGRFLVLLYRLRAPVFFPIFWSVLLVGLGAGCASAPQRSAAVVLNCAQLVKALRERESVYGAMRGRVRITVEKDAASAGILIVSPRSLRMEFVGPMGVTLAMLVMDATWLHFYVPRDKIAYRFPTPELFRDTFRRERFFSLLPIPFDPAHAFDVLMAKTSLDTVDSCRYDSETHLYEVVGTRDGQAVVADLDPIAFNPVRTRVFARVPQTAADRERVLLETNYSEFRGEAIARFPLKAEIWSHNKKKSLVEWSDAELVDDVLPQSFSWRPPAGVTVRDY